MITGEKWMDQSFHWKPKTFRRRRTRVRKENNYLLRGILNLSWLNPTIIYLKDIVRSVMFWAGRENFQPISCNLFFSPAQFLVTHTWPFAVKRRFVDETIISSRSSRHFINFYTTWRPESIQAKNASSEQPKDHFQQLNVGHRAGPSAMESSPLTCFCHCGF